MSETFRYNDGGRKDAGYSGNAGDCACRAIAIVTNIPYQKVYETINLMAKNERRGKRKRSVSNARTGVYRQLLHKYMLALGWAWKPTMQIGQGCKVHLRADELPKGRLLVCVSKHYTTVIDGVINDTYDPSRGGKRCVYGYYYLPDGNQRGKENHEKLEQRYGVGVITGRYIEVVRHDGPSDRTTVLRVIISKKQSTKAAMQLADDTIKFLNGK